MPITQDQIIGLTKQVFVADYLFNGLFPCQSDVTRMIRAKKRPWNANDKFEYRMLLSVTNTGGTLNSQVFDPNVSLLKPGNIDIGTFYATYGTISDGMMVDLTANLETKDKKAAFERDYAIKMHSLRTNVASLFKNFAIHGKFGVVHQIRNSIKAPTVDTQYNPQPNVFTPVTNTPFTIKVPINVFNSNFKKGRYLIKTCKEGNQIKGPQDEANVAELYLILENQPNLLSLISVGTVITDWKDGQFLEVAFNREIEGQPQDTFRSANWASAGITATGGTVWDGQKFDQFNGTGRYTHDEQAIVGAMEGLADLFPWYTNPTNLPESRLGIKSAFRGQPNRLNYTAEQAGGWIYQQQNEKIMDAIMRGNFLTKATVPSAEICIYMNPITRIQLGYEENDKVSVIRENMTAGPIIYQRGIKSTEYQIGNQVIKEVVEDFNMPTDVILIGPKNDLSYNCWDNSIFQIEDYIHETWSGQKAPEPKDLSIPDEFIAKLDISQRLTMGSPTLTDGGLASFVNGNGFRHPKNQMPLALHEMGAIFTEYPYCYTVVKLREPITDLQTT